MTRQPKLPKYIMDEEPPFIPMTSKLDARAAEDWDYGPVSYIYGVFQRNRKEARDLYSKVFGRRIGDPSIEDELEELSCDVLIRGADTALVPGQILLALLLRPRGGKRPPKEGWRARAHMLAVRIANRRWAELAPEKGPSKEAKHKAAQEALGRVGRFAGVGVETLKSQMNLTKGKAELAKRKAELAKGKAKLEEGTAEIEEGTA